MTDREWLLRDKYAGAETPEFFDDLKRLDAGEPLAYVIGFVPFLNCTIYLDSRPLIPRPETEWWTELCIKALSSRSTPFRCLDLFAGSGCVGVALLTHLPMASVDFGEIERKHFATIQRNIVENGIDESRTNIVETDVFSNVLGTYQVIVANPPYIPDNQKLEDSLSFEPKEALFGGKTGTDLLERCITESPKHLEKSGVLYLEFDPGQERAIEKAAKKVGMQVLFHPDQFGLQRLAVLQLQA